MVQKLTLSAILLLLIACAESGSDASSPEASQENVVSPKSPDCGSVTIAEMSWSSAALVAHIDQFILQHGFGCEVRLVSGDTMPTATSMIEQGKPDIAPELWSNAKRAALDKAVAEGRLRYASDVFVQGGEEGFWVPAYMLDDRPELATISGIKAHAGLFRSADSGQAPVFMGCPEGWTCQITARNLFRALKLESAGFILQEPASGADLAASIAAAHENQTSWFGYYWSPTALLGRYPMVNVDFASGVDREHFMDCIARERCAEPRPTKYPPSPVQTVTTTAFASAAPAAYAYLTQRSFRNQDMSQLLAWMEAQQADGAKAARHFLNARSDLWHSWVDSATQARITQALQSQ